MGRAHAKSAFTDNNILNLKYFLSLKITESENMLQGFPRLVYDIDHDNMDILSHVKRLKHTIFINLLSQFLFKMTRFI